MNSFVFPTLTMFMIAAITRFFKFGMPDNEMDTMAAIREMNPVEFDKLLLLAQARVELGYEPFPLGDIDKLT